MGNNTSNQTKHLITQPQLPEKQNIKYTKGNRYEGEMKNGMRHGYGIYFYQNGDRYEGWWECNIKNGMGTFFYKDGSLYVGQWSNNDKNGLGTFYYKSGDKYNGNFLNNKRHGKGCYISSDNSKYIGYFKSNQKHGKGIMYFSKGKIAKEIWKDGSLVQSEFLSEDETAELNQQEISFEMDQYDFHTGMLLHNTNNNNDNIEEHMKLILKKSTNPNSLITQNKMLALQVAKYYKARIPNNYFDAMQIILNTNDLIYDNCKITEWNEQMVLTWFERVGIDKGKYDAVISDNNINGIKLLKITFNELKEYKITDVRDMKIILKSVDFLRIFVRYQLDYIDKIEKEQNDKSIISHYNNSNTNNNNNIVTSSSTFNLMSYQSKPKDNNNIRLRKSFSNTCLPIFCLNSNNLNTLQLSSNVTTALEQSDTSELIEDVENSITKVAITKLLLHSLNLSGFNFYIEYSQLQIIKKIGEGGFGMVFLGTWNEKEVAIKKFTLKEKINIKNILNKFIREINIISNLRHPNIVLYMGVSFHENNYYMITEYIPNGNLFEFLHNKNKNIIDEKLQVKIAYEIAIAMKYLHSRNITHCDMKSSNILLDENFTVKISDFGLSRMVNILNISETKGKFGTTHWMPPEIMKAKKYEEASDVFSYGMIVWEMMTGKVPYYGLAPNQIVGLVADCRKIVEIPKEGNSALRKLVKNCLQYVPDKRPSFEEIIVYLDKVMDFMNNHDYIMDEIYQYVC